MKILALDPATKCGFAHSCGISGTWDLSVRRDESAGMRLFRLRGKLQEIRDSTGIDVLVYEAARNCAPAMQGALVIQATLQGVIQLWCEDNGVEYRGYSPTEVKKHATGKGNAGKPAMIAAAKEKWPGVDIEDDNQADALWILDLAVSSLTSPGGAEGGQ
jgi:Holliday junction resolvasome RuvABC endonuclease subunit